MVSQRQIKQSATESFIINKALVPHDISEPDISEPDISEPDISEPDISELQQRRPKSRWTTLPI